MATNENDLLQRFIDNEKKSKTWTLISVMIFIALAGTIIYFAYLYKQTSNKYKQTSIQLNTALIRADSLNSVNEINKSSLENVTKTAERLKRQYDSLLPKFSPDLANVPIRTDKKNYTIYIQYIASYDNESKSVLSLLQKEKYNAPGRELMRTPTFWSCVKYFNDADKAEAQRVATIINTNIGKFAETPIRILRNNTNVPRGQLEVWLGEIKRLDTEELIQKYNTKIKG